MAKNPKNSLPAAAIAVAATATVAEGSSNQATDVREHHASQDTAGNNPQDTERASQDERDDDAGSAIRPTPQVAELAAWTHLDAEEFRKRYPALSAAYQARFEAGLPAPRAIRITSKQEGFRRANMEHSMTPTEHDQDVFTSPEQLELIFAEPMLVVELI